MVVGTTRRAMSRGEIRLPEVHTRRAGHGSDVGPVVDNHLRANVGGILHDLVTPCQVLATSHTARSNLQKTNTTGQIGSRQVADAPSMLDCGAVVNDRVEPRETHASL